MVLHRCKDEETGQKGGGTGPRSHSWEAAGMDNDVSCDLGQLGHLTYARGHSRREAEQECARQALQWLEQNAASTQHGGKK